jgi:hypothetical protein
MVAGDHDHLDARRVAGGDGGPPGPRRVGNADQAARASACSSRPGGQSAGRRRKAGDDPQAGFGHVVLGALKAGAGGRVEGRRAGGQQDGFAQGQHAFRCALAHQQRAVGIGVAHRLAHALGSKGCSSLRAGGGGARLRSSRRGRFPADRRRSGWPSSPGFRSDPGTTGQPGRTAGEPRRDRAGRQPRPAPQGPARRGWRACGFR